MEIVNYFTTGNKEYWLAKIGESDWGAGKYLRDIKRRFK